MELYFYDTKENENLGTVELMLSQRKNYIGIYSTKFGQFIKNPLPIEETGYLFSGYNYNNDISWSTNSSHVVCRKNDVNDFYEISDSAPELIKTVSRSKSW